MIIDVHSHVVPQGFPAPRGRKSEDGWPQMDHFESGRARVMIGGRNFRTVAEGVWSGARRIEEMEHDGVDAQVISPMPELFSYWLDLEDAIEMSVHLNEYIATLVSAHPGRFFGLGTVPMQNPDAAARALETLRPMGLLGLEVGSNILGKSLGDQRFGAFWAEVERLDLAVFVHALHPTMSDRFTGPEQAVNAVGFPTDTGLTIASLITGGVLEARSGLRLAFSHGGGTFPFLLPRLENAWSGAWNEGEALAPEAPPSALRQVLPRSPAEYARRLYYDTLLFDGRAIRYLAEMMGASQLVIGTDYPFFPRELPVSRTVAGLGLSDGDFAAVGSENALRFLGLS